MGKLRFVQSLQKTADKREALAEAAPLIAKWKAIIKAGQREQRRLSEEGSTLEEGTLAEAHDPAKDEG